MPARPLLLAACAHPSPRHLTPAFYHWRTALALSPTERGYLDSLGCKKLYIKVLDIGRDPTFLNLNRPSKMTNDPNDETLSGT